MRQQLQSPYPKLWVEMKQHNEPVSKQPEFGKGLSKNIALKYLSFSSNNLDRCV